ncbi:hypothetical protein [Homoserinimonas hongtaonis]|uniref:hypothetical protein n=1 Tax=Homoserinimonas hongtaonis TaxID=2079791 RepID=UPI000D37083E|nr:hypothetical protein [Salinibacterium hongtaonis]AWB88755.1 hypothetical protein C2138_03605 [Salinibacterium hongtaonis]
MTTYFDALAAFTFPTIDPPVYRTQDVRRHHRYAKHLRDELDELHPVYMPSPVTMAELVAKPILEAHLGTIYRRPGGRLYTADGEQVTSGERPTILREALAALPPRPDLAHDSAYVGVHTFANYEHNRDYWRDYTKLVAQAAAREGIFPAQPTASPAPRPEALAPAELKARQRERSRATETATARSALFYFLAPHNEDALEPGSRHVARDLYELALPLMEEALAMRDGLSPEEIAEQVDDDGFPELVRLPGPRTFYAVADELLGARHRGAQGVQTYRIPLPVTALEEHPVNAADIRTHADAWRELGDARAYAADELERELSLIERQREFLASGDLGGALAVHAKRHGTGELIEASHRFSKTA